MQSFDFTNDLIAFKNVVYDTIMYGISYCCFNNDFAHWVCFMSCFIFWLSPCMCTLYLLNLSL